MTLAKRAWAADQHREQRDAAADERDPRRQRGAAVPQPVVEVARPEPLQDDPEDERRREHDERAGEQEEGAGEGERQRREAGRATRLREGDGVGEMYEQPRHLEQEQHRHRAAEHERRPAPAPGEGGQRQQKQRRDRDGAAAPEDLGREPVVAVVRHHELVGVLGDRTRALRRRRIVRPGLVDDRAQPEEREADRYDGGREQRRPVAPLARPEHGVGAERDQHEECVRRVDERERPEDRRQRRPGAPRGSGEEERDRRRDEQLPCRRRGLGELGERAAVAGAEARTRRASRRARRPRRPASRRPRRRPPRRARTRAARAARARAA